MRRAPRVNVRQRGVGAGSGVSTEMHYFQLWTFRGGKVIRLEVIADEAEALEAVGLPGVSDSEWS
jgi:ketosteroid isomerase-like protein